MTGDRLRKLADAATFGPWTYCRNDGPPGPGWRFGGARALQESGYAYGEGDAALIAALGPDAARLLADAMDALQGVVLDPEAIEHPRRPTTVTRGMREHMASLLAKFAALGEPS